MPIIAFLFVFLVVYALLSKTEILGENKFFHLLLSFILAIIFVVSPAAVEFTKIALPWIAVFLVVLVFILMVLVFVGGNLDDMINSPFLTYAAVGILLAIFLFAGIKVIGPILQSSQSIGTGVSTVIFHPAVLGAVLLLIIAAVVSWVLTKD